MPTFKFNGIKITGIASAVPTTIVSVDSFKDRFGEGLVEQFKASTGIKEYRKTHKHQTASDLGFVAAEKIIAEKDIDRKSIGALVFVAHSTDYRRPATACVLHKRLGLDINCVAFDIALGCSAFVYGVQTVASIMQSSDIERALLIVGETLTKMVNPKDSSTAMLFGDGGAAILLEKTDADDEIIGLLKTDGSGYKAIIAPAGGFRNLDATNEDMTWSDGNIRSLYNTNMNGVDVFSFTITKVPKTIKEFLKHNNRTIEDYDVFAMHQANYYIHQQLSKKLKVPLEKMPVCLDRYGNTSAPAIPLLLCDCFGDETGKEIKMLTCGFGVGLSWGVMEAVINADDIFSVIETDDYFEEGVINGPKDM